MSLGETETDRHGTRYRSSKTGRACGIFRWSHLAPEGPSCSERGLLRVEWTQHDFAIEGRRLEISPHHSILERLKMLEDV